MSKIEEQVISKIRARSEAGRKKYDTTMEREDLTLIEWLQHAQEEAMDLAVYLEKIIEQVSDVWQIEQFYYEKSTKKENKR